MVLFTIGCLALRSLKIFCDLTLGAPTTPSQQESLNGMWCPEWEGRPAEGKQTAPNPTLCKLAVLSGQD